MEIDRKSAIVWVTEPFFCNGWAREPFKELDFGVQWVERVGHRPGKRGKNCWWNDVCCRFPFFGRCKLQLEVRRVNNVAKGQRFGQGEAGGRGVVLQGQLIRVRDGGGLDTGKVTHSGLRALGCGSDGFAIL